MRRYTHRFQKLVGASLRFSFPPASLWEVKKITFRIQEVIRVRSWRILGAIKAAAVVNDIIAFLTTAGLLYWVGVLWRFGNFSRFRDRTIVLEFGKIGVWLIITEICDEILSFVNSHNISVQLTLFLRF